jgi:uncharacterized protein (TIGR03435 family)
MTILLFLVCAAFGQAASPAFDVASIKLNTAEVQRERGALPRRATAVHVEPGAVTIRQLSLMDCIRWAFQLSRKQVVGPDWLNTANVDVAAKAAGPVPEAELRRMLQTLLVDRFKIASHRETKELAVYTLAEAKGGIKCKPEEADGEIQLTPGRGGVLSLQRVTVSQIADLFTDVLDQPLIDQTGLKGRYTCTLDPRASQPEPGQEDDKGAMIIAGLQQQFGLKVEQKKAPMEVLIIDHIEKMPAEN